MAKAIKEDRSWIRLALCVMLALTATERVFAASQAPKGTNWPVTVLNIEGPPGSVKVKRTGAADWDNAWTNQVLKPGDRLRTADNGRALLRWSDNSMVRLPPLVDLEMEPPSQSGSMGLQLLKGLLYFFHRDGPTGASFRTRTAAAAIRGTEFVLGYSEADGRTTVTVLDGEVVLGNLANQTTSLVSGEQGIVDPGTPPRKTAVIEAINAIQWCLYYPGVLDPDELELATPEREALANSLAAYRSGDLLGALAKYPASRVPVTPEENVYRAGVLLAVGQVEQAERLLGAQARENGGNSRAVRLANALRKMVAAVKLQSQPSPPNPDPAPLLSSEWLADSYHRQSRSNLRGALEAARQAVTNSPQFGLGWARVAELEFCFGETSRALAALDKALEFSPDNPQAVALKGFLLAAKNNIPAAMICFERAIALDGGLGNAWLGRGLCKMRRGQVREGNGDLEAAAAVEPQRALFRSYLGKGYSELKDNSRARRELKLAQAKDPNDPTAWLYSALLDQQENRINEAVRELEKSQELNTNRSVYRSQFLLDQDRAVRGANLASIYRDAGMSEVATREAGRAVTVDPANYSAHLFLANSYYEMLDPHQYNQRYEAARVNEYLTATLLAPVGAGLLSQPVSAQEYSRLFERDGLGLYSGTEYLSRGAVQQYGAQYGRFANSSYSVDGYYRWDPGQRPNNDLEQYYTSLQLKQQITANDSVYLQTAWSRATYGDLEQVYDPATGGNRTVRNKETQEPLLLLGYHREWSPGNHTLLLAGRLQDTLRVADPAQGTLLLTRVNPVSFEQSEAITGVTPFTTAQTYRSELEVYSVEAQQILQRERYALIGGGRYQAGSIDTQNTNSIIRYENAAGSTLEPVWFQNPGQDFRSDLERMSFYGYGHLQVHTALRLIAGLSYDWLQYPENSRYGPISGRDQTAEQVSPKGGLVWTPFESTTLRAAYAQSLGGASLEQSILLEPSQVAGFNQLWRSIIPESVGGANAGASFENWNVSLEQKLPTRTYLGLGGEILDSQADRMIGAYTINAPEYGVFPLPPFISQSATRQHLDYQERALTFTLNQLVGEGWALGVRYRLSHSELQGEFPDIPASAATYGGFVRQSDQTAILHQVNLYILYTHRSGFFAEGQALWTLQQNGGDSASLPSDDFWQLNAFIGYRFPRRQAEVRVGVLNITGQDYRLNPLSLMSELPRDRTLLVSAKFSF